MEIGQSRISLISSYNSWQTLFQVPLEKPVLQSFASGLKALIEYTPLCASVSVIRTISSLKTLSKSWITRSEIFSSIMCSFIALIYKSTECSDCWFKLGNPQSAVFQCNSTSLRVNTTRDKPSPCNQVSKGKLLILVAQTSPVVLSQGVCRPLVWCTVSAPRHVPQYVHDSVLNVSHLPEVNYRVQRWIQIYKSTREKKKIYI